VLLRTSNENVGEMKMEGNLLLEYLVCYLFFFPLLN